MIQREIYDALRELFIVLAAQDQQLLQEFALDIPMFEALRLLNADEGWRMGELGQAILVDNSKMTRVVDALEEAGLAKRAPDPADRRAQLVFITPEGEALRTAANEAHKEALVAGLAAVRPTNQMHLARLLQQWRASLSSS